MVFFQNWHLSVLALQSTASTRVGTKSRQVTVNTPLSLWFELTNRLWIKRAVCYALVPRGPHVSKMHNSRTVGYCLLYWTFCTIILYRVEVGNLLHAWFVYLNWIYNVYVSFGNLVQTRRTLKFIVVCVERFYHVVQSESGCSVSVYDENPWVCLHVCPSDVCQCFELYKFIEIGSECKLNIAVWNVCSAGTVRKYHIYIYRIQVGHVDLSICFPPFLYAHV